MQDPITTPQSGASTHALAPASAPAVSTPVEKARPDPCNGRWRFPARFDEEGSAPSIRWLVSDLIPMNAVVLLYGESYSGKTGLAVHLVRCVAQGLPFFGRATLRLPAVYIALENGDDADAHLRAVQADERADGSLWKWPDTVAFSDRSIDLTNSADVFHLIQDVKKIAPNGAMIVVDALLDGIGTGNIVLNEVMNPVMQKLHEIAVKCSGPVVVLHHANRTEERSPLGATCILSRSDVHIKVEPRARGAVWKAEKVKGSTRTDWHAYRFQRVDLGTNADGQKMTSCVVVEDAEATPKAKASKSAPQKATKPALSKKTRVSESAVPDEASEEAPPAPAQSFQGWRTLPTA